jgi:sarcosine oxidase subunit gamma
MLSVMPTAFLRRSPLYRWHADAGATFVEQDSGASPERYPGLPADLPACALADLSLRPRLGAKGWETWSTLASIGIGQPEANNRALRLPGGGAVLRLGDNEAFLLSDTAGDAPLLRRAAALSDTPGFFPVPRQDTHAWLLLLGEHAPALLSKVCAIDFRPDRFADLAIAQTMIARVGAVVLRCDAGGILAFHLLADTASALYLWTTLLQAANEYAGRAVGFEMLRSIAAAPVEQV